MHLDTSLNIRGNTARLVSPRKQGSGGRQSCILKFWYQYAKDSGILNGIAGLLAWIKTKPCCGLWQEESFL